MQQQQKLFWALELVWWVLTAVVVLGVLYPILTKVGDSYPFYQSNILFIVVFITFTRLIFLLKHSFLVNWEKIKIGLIMVTPVLLFYLVNEINYFQTFLDEKGVENFLAQMSIPDREALRKYITAEMLLFGTGSLIAVVVLPIRLLLSIWRLRNRGTV
ncbi:MAG: hypothetical protein AAF960_09145 [Bacteroidota bacterium]